MDKRTALKASVALDRVRLAAPAFALYERWQGLRREHDTHDADGLAIPSPALRYKVIGTTDVSVFLQTGREQASVLRRILGSALSGDVLDFGVGCGRVARHLVDEVGSLHGCDYNPRLARWTRRNLPLADVRRNALTPPLPWASGSFDAIYALSLLTHWPAELQRAWMREWRRVLRPGGRLVASTHGEHFAKHMLPHERERFDAGELVVRHDRAAGSNLCVTYHPLAWVQRELTSEFTLAHVESAALAGQDVLVFEPRS